MSGIFGGGAQSKKMARPLSHTPTVHGLRGLGGALGDVVPWQCWDKPGFKDCHAANWTKAATYCKALIAEDGTMYGGDINRCIGESTDAADWANCVPKYCPPVSGAGGMVWRGSQPNATVRKLQSDLNVHLKALGWDLLSADGILGSGTCGAAKYVDDLRGTTFFRDYGLDKLCQTSKVPTKGGKPINTVAVAPQVTITGQSATVASTNLPWEQFSEDTAEIQRRLNIQLDSADMNLLNVDGKLNAPTCGAMRWQKDTQGFDVLTTSGKNCQGFTAPTKRVKVATPVVIAPPSTVDPNGPTTSAPPKTALASMATTGLLVGVGAVGLYFVGKKYSWF